MPVPAKARWTKTQLRGIRRVRLLGKALRCAGQCQHLQIEGLSLEKTSWRFLTLLACWLAAFTLIIIDSLVVVQRQQLVLQRKIWFERKHTHTPPRPEHPQSAYSRKQSLASRQNSCDAPASLSRSSRSGGGLWSRSTNPMDMAALLAWTPGVESHVLTFWASMLQHAWVIVNLQYNTILYYRLY